MNLPKSYFPLAELKGEGARISVDPSSAVEYVPGDAPDKLVRRFVSLDEFSSDYLQGQLDAVQWFLDHVHMKHDDEKRYEAVAAQFRAELAKRKEGGS